MTHEYPNFLSEQKFESPTPPPPKKSRGVFFFLAFIVFLCIGIFVTRALVHVEAPQNPDGYDLTTLEPKKPTGIFGKLKGMIFRQDVELLGFDDDRINILILGQGGPGHDGPYLTDTIIVASIKPSTNQVAMMSIPRDLEVNIPGYGKRKINHANAFAEAKKSGTGPEAAKQVIEDTFDLTLHYYVRVDFSAFEDLIDQVGGVSIDVDTAFVDAEYPIPGRENALPVSSRYKILRFRTGVQHMDGQTALEYARSRHGNNGEGSDYARSRRQQKVLLALKEKLLSFETLANPAKIYEIISTLESHIATDLEFSDMIAFAKIGRELNTSEIINLTLDDSPTGYLQSGHDSIGSFVLRPKTQTFDVIQEDWKSIFTPESRAQVVETHTPTQEASPLRTAVIEIHNGTWQPGLAAELKSTLEQESFVVGAIGNSTERPQKTSAIYVIRTKEGDSTVELLQKELNIPIKNTLPTGENSSQASDILVVIGEDFK